MIQGPGPDNWEILPNASGTARRGRVFHTPSTYQIAYKIIISGKLIFFYWQLLIILFAVDIAKKKMELYLFVLREGKNIFLARQFSARPRLLARRGHGFHTRPYMCSFTYMIYVLFLYMYNHSDEFAT